MLFDVLREHNRAKERSEKLNFNALRVAFTGGATVPQTIVEKLQNEFKIQVQVPQDQIQVFMIQFN